MDNQQENLQFTILTSNINLDDIVLHKNLFTSNEAKLDFIRTYCSMSASQQEKHYNIGRGALTTIRQKLVTYLEKLPLPDGFLIVPITGFIKYAIHQDGTLIRVRDRYLISKHIDETGYYRVNIIYELNGKLQKYARLHRLLALTYLPSVENKPHINHIDGNKLNNSISNLEWCTPKENTQHAISTGLAPQEYKKDARPYRRKLTNEQIVTIQQSDSTITNISLATLFNVSETTVANYRKL